MENLSHLYQSSELIASEDSKLRELAAKGVHQAAARVLPHYISPPGRIVELGAGAGAFSHRLRTLGYVVTGSDVEATQFKAAGLPFVCCDLDAEWPEALQRSCPDALCAVEVIEHLRHPWKFFEQCHSMLRSGGILLLSTPNVSSKWSRAYFLAKGVPLGFGRRNMLAIGHINPMTSYEIDHIASSNGFELLRRIPVGRFRPPECADVRDRLRHFVFSCFVALLRPVMCNLEDGYCYVMVYRRI